MSAITNPKRAEQLINFENYKWGKVSATDVDAVMEWKNKAYVLIEVKAGNKALSMGQRIALERMCDDLSKAKPTILIVGRHRTPVGYEVDLGNCQVGSFYENGTWYNLEDGPTVKAFTDNFLSALELN